VDAERVFAILATLKIRTRSKPRNTYNLSVDVRPRKLAGYTTVGLIKQIQAKIKKNIGLTPKIQHEISNATPLYHWIA